MSTINRQLKLLNLELAQARMEDRAEVWYGVVNRSPDVAAKISSSFSPAELELFNKVVGHCCAFDYYLCSKYRSLHLLNGVAMIGVGLHAWCHSVVHVGVFS